MPSRSTLLRNVWCGMPPTSTCRICRRAPEPPGGAPFRGRARTGTGRFVLNRPPPRCGRPARPWRAPFPSLISASRRRFRGRQASEPGPWKATVLGTIPSDRLGRAGLPPPEGRRFDRLSPVKDNARHAEWAARFRSMTNIPTEPIGSIPRPLSLIEAIAADRGRIRRWTRSTTRRSGTPSRGSRRPARRSSPTASSGSTTTSGRIASTGLAEHRSGRLQDSVRGRPHPPDAAADRRPVPLHDATRTATWTWRCGTPIGRSSRRSSRPRP